MSFSLTVVLLGNPTQGLADDGIASAVASGAGKATQQPKSSELLEIVSVDYCYAGSMVDPASGEKVDLFVFCTDDAIAGNLDLA
jgi:hypothetical protein